MPYIAHAQTITSKQAREFVNGYFGLTTMYAALAQECHSVSSGNLTGRYGIISWLGDSDEHDAWEKSRIYHELRLKLMERLSTLMPSQKFEIEEAIKSAGGEEGLTQSMRRSMTIAKPDFDQFGQQSQTAYCATYKSVVVSTAAQIGQTPQNSSIMP